MDQIMADIPELPPPNQFNVGINPFRPNYNEHPTQNASRGNLRKPLNQRWRRDGSDVLTTPEPEASFAALQAFVVNYQVPDRYVEAGLTGAEELHTILPCIVGYQIRQDSVVSAPATVWNNGHMEEFFGRMFDRDNGSGWSIEVGRPHLQKWERQSAPTLEIGTITRDPETRTRNCSGCRAGGRANLVPEFQNTGSGRGIYSFRVKGSCSHYMSQFDVQNYDWGNVYGLCATAMRQWDDQERLFETNLDEDLMLFWARMAVSITSLNAVDRAQMLYNQPQNIPSTFDTMRVKMFEPKMGI